MWSFQQLTHILGNCHLKEPYWALLAFVNKRTNKLTYITTIGMLSQPKSGH